jgi:hypothetical protein
MTSSVFYVQYKVRPTAQNELWGEAGGAYVHCYRQAAGAEKAARAARETLFELHWEVLSVEEGPSLVNRAELTDLEQQEHFDTAALDGECFVYHLWPSDPQDDDPVH